MITLYEPADRDAYARCQEVAQVAHQLGRPGVLAPAATSWARPSLYLPDLAQAAGEVLQRASADVLWEALPRDPGLDNPRHDFASSREFNFH